MVPRDKKDKQGPTDSSKEKRRRNSLVDSSSSSSASSSACSTGSASGTDSDGASTGSVCDTKGTMTSPPLIEEEDDLDANSNAFFEAKKISTRFEQRPIRKESPINGDNGFRSLSHQYPLNNEGDVPTSSKNTEKGGTEKQRTSPLGDNAQKDKKKTGKASSKKKREKKNRDEELKRQGKTSPTYTAYNVESLREMVEFSKVKETLSNAFSPENQFVKEYAVRDYASSSNNFMDSSHIKHCGFGISATGLYDVIPKVRGQFKKKASSRNYTDICNRHDYWKDFDINRHESNVDKIDNVEKEYLSEMHSKLESRIAKIENKWIGELLLLITKGKVRKVWSRIQKIEATLREMPGNHPYARMGRNELLAIIAKGVTDLLVDPDDNFNIFMYLSSFCQVQRACYWEHHGRCMTLDLLLSLLSPICRRNVLGSETIKAKRRPIHFAAITGQPCQLEILLKYDVDPNCFDNSRRAPIHYIRQRNNIMMLRHLMWHGADLSLVEPRAGTVPYCLVTPDIQDLQFWMMTRMTALERSLLSWVKTLIGTLFIVNDQPVTSLHQCRLIHNDDYKEEEEKKGHVDERDFELSVKNTDPRGPDEQVFLVALPVCYSVMDAITPAENPHIVRTEMCSGAGRKPVRLFSSPPVIRFQHDETAGMPLVSAINEEHNGHIYVYRMPRDVKQVDRPRIHLQMNSSSMGSSAHSTHLLIQAFVCTGRQRKPKME